MTEKENNEVNVQDMLKNLSQRDFLNFGIHDVAYIRPVYVENRPAFAIHAADGTPLSVMESLDSAIMVVRHNELEPATIH